jgi:hypothetical protein
VRPKNTASRNDVLPTALSLTIRLIGAMFGTTKLPKARKFVISTELTILTSESG